MGALRGLGPGHQDLLVHDHYLALAPNSPVRIQEGIYQDHAGVILKPVDVANEVGVGKKEICRGIRRLPFRQFIQHQDAKGVIAAQLVAQADYQAVLSGPRIHSFCPGSQAEGEP